MNVCEDLCLLRCVARQVVPGVSKDRVAYFFRANDATKHDIEPTQLRHFSSSTVTIVGLTVWKYGAVATFCTCDMNKLCSKCRLI